MLRDQVSLGLSNLATLPVIFFYQDVDKYKLLTFLAVIKFHQ